MKDLGLKLLPVNNLVVVNQLISDGHYCGQTGICQHDLLQSK